MACESIPSAFFQACEGYRPPLGALSPGDHPWSSSGAHAMAPGSGLSGQEGPFANTAVF